VRCNILGTGYPVCLVALHSRFKVINSHRPRSHPFANWWLPYVLPLHPNRVVPGRSCYAKRRGCFETVGKPVQGHWQEMKPGPVVGTCRGAQTWTWRRSGWKHCPLVSDCISLWLWGGTFLDFIMPMCLPLRIGFPRAAPALLQVAEGRGTQDLASVEHCMSSMQQILFLLLEVFFLICSIQQFESTIFNWNAVAVASSSLLVHLFKCSPTDEKNTSHNEY
jgi:hypothetical protein